MLLLPSGDESESEIFRADADLLHEVRSKLLGLLGGADLGEVGICDYLIDGQFERSVAVYAVVRTSMRLCGFDMKEFKEGIEPPGQFGPKRRKLATRIVAEIDKEIGCVA